MINSRVVTCNANDDYLYLNSMAEELAAFQSDSHIIEHKITELHGQVKDFLNVEV